MSMGYSRKFRKPKKSAYYLNRRKRYFNRRNINEYFYKQNNSITWQTKVVFLFLTFIVFYFVYFFFFSNYFKITQVIVSGNKDISSLEIKKHCNNFLNQRRFLLFKNNNYFLFNNQELIKKLKGDYFFDELTVNKRYFSTLFVNLKERSSKLLYVINNIAFSVDKNGIVISEINYQNQNDNAKQSLLNNDEIVVKEIPEQIIINQDEIDAQAEKIVKDNKLYKDTHSTSTVFIWEDSDEGPIVKEVAVIEPQIKDVYPDAPSIGSQVFLPDKLEKILYLDKNYNQKFKNKRHYYKFHNDNKSKSIKMITRNGFAIYFKLDQNIDSQLSNLYRYVVEEGNNLDNIEYIDLRQNNQIIIK